MAVILYAILGIVFVCVFLSVELWEGWGTHIEWVGCYFFVLFVLLCVWAQNKTHMITWFVTQWSAENTADDRVIWEKKIFDAIWIKRGKHQVIHKQIYWLIWIYRYKFILVYILIIGILKISVKASYKNIAVLIIT